MSKKHEEMTESLISHVMKTQHRWWNNPAHLTDYVSGLFRDMFRFPIKIIFEDDTHEVHYNDPITQTPKKLTFKWNK